MIGESGVSPFEMLAILDDAIATQPRPRGIALELRNPQVLGHRGKHLGTDDGGLVYGYTRRQCERMRDTIREAARSEVGE